MELPPELIDYSIDFLHDDYYSLGVCSLVCRSWVPASRYHMFQHVTLRRRWSRMVESQFGVFLLLLANERYCTFPQFVTHLTLQDIDPTRAHGLEFHPTYPILRKRLPELTSITFLRWQDLGKQPLGELVPYCSKLTELKLDSAVFNKTADCFHILALLPLSLESLTIASTFWRPSTAPRPSVSGVTFPAACSIRTLRLKNCLFAEILDLLVSESTRTNTALRCATLELSGLVPQFLESTGLFLAHVGSSLQHVELGFSESEEESSISFSRYVDWSKNTALRSFSLNAVAPDTFSTPDRTTTAKALLPGILRSLSWSTHRSIEAIHLLLDLSSPTEVDNILTWDELDGLLDSMTWLRKVALTISINCQYRADPRVEYDEAISRIVQQLPRMAQRDSFIVSPGQVGYRPWSADQWGVVY